MYMYRHTNVHELHLNERSSSCNFSQQLDIIVSHVHIHVHSHSFLHIFLPTKLLWNYGTYMYILDIANSLYILMYKRHHGACNHSSD